MEQPRRRQPRRRSTAREQPRRQHAMEEPRRQQTLHRYAMEEPHRQDRIRNIRDKFLNSEHLLKIAMLFFTMICFLQEKLNIHVWLPVCTSILACVVLRRIRSSIRPENLRIVANNKVVVLVSNLLIYGWGFMWLQKLRTNIPARQKEQEDILVLIYIVPWYFIEICLEVFGDTLWLRVLTQIALISNTIRLVVTILCFEESLDEDSALCVRLYAAWIIVMKYAITFILVIFTGLLVKFVFLAWH